MKRFFITLAMMLVAFMTNARSCPDSNHPHAIELELPSIKKWACCNVRTTTPEGYGSYYVRGETEEEEIGIPGSDETPTVTIDGLLYKLSEATHTAMIANGNVWDGELFIPEQISHEGETYTVDRMEWLAFDFCKTLTKVRIPKTVVDIRHYAQRDDCKNPFTGCTNLESIEVDEANPSMCSVDGVLFNKDMTRLYCYPAGARGETYIVPEGVTWLGSDTFAYNPYLLSVKMPNSVSYMAFGIFESCNNLKSVQLSKNIKHIAAGTFESCDNLRFLDIPESVTSFAESVFRWSPLDTIIIRGTFPDGLRSDTFYFMDEGRTVIYCQPSEIDEFKKVFKGTVLPLNEWIEDVYRLFVEDGKVWKFGAFNSGNPVQIIHYYYFDGDTIIDGKTCKQMMCQKYVSPDYPNYDSFSHPNYLSKMGAWYEEDKKVYFCYEGTQSLRMMYDFSLGANDTLYFMNDYPDYRTFIIGPKQTRGLKGFKGVYRDIMMCQDEGQNIHSTFWLEGVGGIDGTTANAFDPTLVDLGQFLMSCTVGDEVIYLNDEYEDGATPKDMEARKNRFDFTHTIKTKPKEPSKRREELSLYGEYDDSRLGINLNSLDDAYLVRIINESGEVVYEKTVNASAIVGLDIDISSYAKGRYTVTVENSVEAFTGLFETQTSGIETISYQPSAVKHHIYNLHGQRLSSLQKGLNIVNGRKLFVK